MKTHVQPTSAIQPNAIEKQHMKMHIKIDRNTETLNQGNCVSVDCGFYVTCFLTYICGDGAIDDARGLAHDSRLAGEQEPQLV